MEKLKDIWYKVYDKLFFPIERLFSRIKLTWDWYWNVLRYDCDWDWTDICIVLKYKLERTRKCLEQGHHVRAYRDAKQIRICELLLDRIEKDAYIDYLFKQHNKRWGKLKIEWEPTDNPDITRSIIGRSGVMTPEQEEQESKEFRMICKHEDYMQKQDMELLGRYLTKYLRNWWD